MRRSIMLIPTEEIERIKTMRSIAEFLENPKRAGACVKACCPLPGHDDRTPSFYLYPDGGYWCFGCHRGGKDVISFAFHYWGLSYPKDFPLALERLGARVNGQAASRPFLPALAAAHTPKRETWP